jgi:rSAM/selenodomain-associated transferase 1
MARSPRLGRVKRRLAAEIGAVTATRAYRLSLAHTLARLGRSPLWRTTLAVTPDEDLRAGVWEQLASVSGLGRMLQGAGDLGLRMQRLFARVPPGPCIIVGGDIPGVRAQDVADAFRLLARYDAVIGPAEDGGYWLIGLKRFPRLLRPFENVRWSGSRALSDTLANLAGARIAYARTRADLDRKRDFEILGRDLERRI